MVRTSQNWKKKLVTSTPKKAVSPEEISPAVETPSSKRRKSTSYYKKKSKSPKSPGEKRKHRFRPGTVALQEIRHFQKGTGLLIPKLSFSRLIREILSGMDSNYRIQTMALMALQEAAECYIIGILELANLCSIHAKRVTLFPQDVKLVRRIRGDT
ncbi:uncharacterized protein [Panulirus ornatus]|uniref:uncharacterized protein isoform X1 n=1 Tax=Panulirus ornatus TaxID=150431 RepID=UPI003A885CE7